MIYILKCFNVFFYLKFESLAVQLVTIRVDKSQNFHFDQPTQLMMANGSSFS